MPSSHGSRSWNVAGAARASFLRDPFLRRTTASAIALSCFLAWGPLSSTARGDLFSVPSSLCGTYNAAGGYGNSLAHQNYRVGLSPITTTPETRNFFTFDLSPMAALPPGSVTGAAVKLYMPHFAPPFLLDPGDGYISPDPFEHYVLSSTPFSSAALAAPIHSPAEAMSIWATLGTGPVAGDIVTTPEDKGTILTIPLTPPAVAAINATIGHGSISFGGRIESFAGTFVDELLFGFTDIPSPHMVGKEPKLEFTVVPEPGTAVLMISAVLMVIRRRRRAALSARVAMEIDG